MVARQEDQITAIINLCHEIAQKAGELREKQVNPGLLGALLDILGQARVLVETDDE
jgi:hypothetical protein